MLKNKIHLNFEIDLIVSNFDPKIYVSFFKYQMIQTYQEILSGLSLFEIMFLIAFVFVFFIRFLYLVLFTARVLFQANLKSATEVRNPVSLILTARNEENCLRKNLPSILSLNNPDYEVVVVDDFSQDNSFIVLGTLKKEFKRLKISTLNEETRYSMKLAQNIAIKAAVNDWVLAIPVTLEKIGAEWLSATEKELTENKTVVVSYSGIEPANQFYNTLYRIENFWAHVKSTGFILNGLPFVYSDENVAFRKKEYFRIGGYGQKIKEPFANLELLINSFIRKKTTTVLFSAETSIRKSAAIQWSDYLDLLKKSFRIEEHLSISKRIILAFEEGTRMLFLPLSIYVIILLPELWILITSLLFIKLSSHLFIIKIMQKHLNEAKIFISSLLYDSFIVYFKFFYRWYFNRKNRKNKWRSKI